MTGVEGLSDCGVRRLPRIASVLLAGVLAVALAGCGTISEQTAADVFISTSKYQLYTCKDVEDLTATTQARSTELQQLMARASQGFGGELVNTLAYRTEYLQARGELTQLKKVSAEKQCATESKFSSGRAVF